jgi:hypothetical protein
VFLVVLGCKCLFQLCLELYVCRLAFFMNRFGALRVVLRALDCIFVYHTLYGFCCCIESFNFVIAFFNAEMFVFASL